jgi:hypothetical protein
MYLGEQLSALTFGPIFMILSACAFLALPISRKRAKVRWAHVWRVMLYGLSFMILPLLFIKAALILRVCEFGGDPIFTKSSLKAAAALSNFVCPVMMGIYWFVAIRRYLRMEQSIAIALSIFLIGFGLAIAVMFFLTRRLSPPGFWHEIVRAMA